MASNYDNSALFYDQLSKVVFGKALVNAQLYLLKQVKPNSSVLIVGGGTGWILEELSTIHYSGLDITYVEISSRMMALAQKRYLGINKITFVNQAVENTPIQQSYDAIITPFLFDSFTEQTFEKVFSHLDQQLKPKGIWLLADFQTTGKLWQKALLKTMYLFFKILCRIETLNLPDINGKFKQYGYMATSVKTFYGKFIISKKYQKKVHI